MIPENNILAAAGGVGMELCWLHAWAAFLLYSIFGRIWPLALSAGVYGLAAIAARTLSGKKIHRAGLALLRIVVFNAGFTAVLYQFSQPTLDVRDLARFSESLAPADGQGPWFFLFILLAITFLFWKRGSKLASDPPTSKNAYNRFDLGLAAFLVLLIAKTLLSVRGGVNVPHPEVTRILFPFLLFSLLTIGAARHAGEGRKAYIPGFQKIGVVLSFSTVVLVLGAGLVALFYSDLIAGAEILSSGLKKAGAPLLPLLKTMLRFLMMHDIQIEEAAPDFAVNHLRVTGSPDAVEPSTRILSVITQWLPPALVLATFLFIIGLVAWLLIKIMFSKAEPDADAHYGRRLFASWLSGLKTILKSCLAGIRRRLKGCARGVELYAALSAWGRRGGVSRRPVETPGEYGSRLSAAFPPLEKEIGLIIELLHRELYGEIVLDRSEMITGSQALKELGRLAWLPMRMKNWLFSNGGRAWPS